MIGWKQGYTLDRSNVVLIKLDIPEDAKLGKYEMVRIKKSYLFTDKAKVLSITSIDGKHEVSKAVSMKDPCFYYTVGEEVKARRDVSLGTCAGIYFFKTKKEAINYEY